MTNSLIPRITEPISAYDLLTKVCEVITEEPKRYKQDSWILSATVPLHRTSRLDFPACGTICCVAGWVQTLATSPESVLQSDTDEWWTIGNDAQDTLGLTEDQAWELFDADVLYALTVDMPSRGTPEYAALGVQHIQNFQAKYADQLKAKIVEPVR